MSILVTPTQAPAPRSTVVVGVALVYAVALVIMAVAELFFFEELIEAAAMSTAPVGALGRALFAPLLVTAQVFALPFLLRMPVSPAFRWLSMGLGWLAAAMLFAAWLLLAAWWVVCGAAVLGALAAWASWGLWPGNRH